MASQAWFVLLSVLLPSACLAQVHDVLCNAGNTSFEASFSNRCDNIHWAPKGRGILDARVSRNVELGQTETCGRERHLAADLDMFGVDLILACGCCFYNIEVK